TELEAAFEAATQEQEQTGAITEKTQQRCTDLFAELGKKVDRIARYVRATEFKARAAKEEATRLAARQKSAESRVEQVKSMVAFFMHSRGLKRLEGELNTIRLQRNGQPSLRIDPFVLPGEYNQTTITLAHQDWGFVLDSITSPELRRTLEAAVMKVEPNKELVRQQLQAGKPIPGAELVQGEHVRFN
ncbi:MAG TPA: siphovirus Gp157 family protein, partial [Terriglobales bacterium]|nr:siphovirus Gp157 family protein [Terriglobales bacterium]